MNLSLLTETNQYQVNIHKVGLTTQSTAHK